MLGWVVAVTVGWGVLAVAVAVVVGRVVRLRDRQVPHREPHRESHRTRPAPPVPPIPSPRASMDPAVERDREPG